MSTIQHSIDVNVPLRHVYDQWTQFEDFPYFMEGVESVRQLDDTHLHWVATVGGKRKEWDAVITEQVPDSRIAWTSTTGAPNAGMVDFERVSDSSTRVTLTMDVQPETGLEKAGDALGIPSGQVKGDLEKFKKYIEDRGSATGSWRGEVEGGQVASRGGSTGGFAGSRSAGYGREEDGLAGNDYGSGAPLGTGGNYAEGEASRRGERELAGAGTTMNTGGSMSGSGTSMGSTGGYGGSGSTGYGHEEHGLAGNDYGSGAPVSTGGNYAEGQASERGERELAGTGTSMNTGGATADDPYGLGGTNPGGTDYDRSLGQPGLGGTTDDVEDSLDAGRNKQNLSDI